MSSYSPSPDVPNHGQDSLQHSPLPTRSPSESNSHPLLDNSHEEKPLEESSNRNSQSFWTRRRGLLATIAFVVVVIVVLVIALPVHFLVVRPKSRNASSGAAGGSGGGAGGGSSGPGGTGPSSSGGPTSGGDGSVVTLENGTQFTYQNSFGGFWVTDPSNPYNNGARPNSWTPPLNSTWTWGVDHVYGVNLGGLFVTEPFITPGLYQKYPGSTDEFTLSQAMRSDTASGGINQLEEHYKTFITEQDIAEIAGAGLNFLRIPIAFWAIETWDGEPYLAKTSWTYFLKVLGWARKYGLRVFLDLHAVPGSQNGLNHSGKLGTINFLNGNMGLATAERTMYYIRVLTEFISQPEYRDLIPAFGIVNEPQVGTIGMDVFTSFNLKAHDMIRGITGLGAGHGPFISIQSGFQDLAKFHGYLQGSDRVILDQHPYFAFNDPDTSPIATPAQDDKPGGNWPRQACQAWAGPTSDSQRQFGVTVTGEFSSAPNDCGLFVRGVGVDATYPQCSDYNNWQNYNDTMKQGLMNYILASMDATQDWMYWTWKIGPDSSGQVQAPLWSYKLGLENGWIPKDPRASVGKCVALGAPGNPFTGSFESWQTGGSTSSIPASSSSSFPWPPTTVSNIDVDMTLLPTYTNTAPIITMPPATFMGAPSSVTASVVGWFDREDTEGGVTTVAGCNYPDEYSGSFAVTPTARCTGS